ncbi:hypothetical protein FQN60_016185, partial [Etheostoma spectabile]
MTPSSIFLFLFSPFQTVSSSGHGRPESPVYTNLQELKITTTNLPPFPSGSPLHVMGDWDTYKDSTGRHFYYNRCTLERTWKPPRARDTSSGSSRGESHSAEESSETTPLSLSPSFLPFLSLSIGRLQPLSSEDACFSTYSSQSDFQYGSPPLGWSEEMDEHGHTLYISDYTNEKWLKHTDEQGRPYYYSADGSRSEWELPKYNHSPPQPPGDALKSRSLDRKHVEPIVLTKWRHSAYVQDTNDKDTPLGPKPPSPDSDSCPSSPKPPASVSTHPSPTTRLCPAAEPSEKCGVLNVTKITEHGKKVRKNWTSSWTVLQGSTLLFAKGQGGGTSWLYYHRDSFPEFLLSLLSNWRPSARKRPVVSYGCSGLFGGAQSKPEFTVDLRGGSVEWASKDKSSKKHVVEVKTRQGTELLIQSDNDGLVNDWYRALQDTISTHAWESDEAIEEDLPESPGVEKHDKEKDQRDSKKGRVSFPQSIMAISVLRRVVDNMSNLSSAAMRTSTSMDVSENKKTKHKLKKFLTRRPTLQAVRDKGYIKDQVFGCSLSSLCQRENVTVPTFVKMCIDHVENTDEKVNLMDDKWEDIHVTTGALKMYFRELPEPLFTYALFHDFVSAIKVPDYKQRVQAIKDLIKQLPKPNHDTMQALFKHLRRVIDHGEENRMTTQSVAIVFGPTLLRPETETWNIAVHMVYQNQIVELILLEYENIFGSSFSVARTWIQIRIQISPSSFWETPASVKVLQETPSWGTRPLGRDLPSAVGAVQLEETRIVLLGLPGEGKSSSGNTILGEELFKSDLDFNAVSMKTVSKSAEVEGRWVTVVDTPGLTDEVLSPEQLYNEIMRSLIYANPGPHAFVIVVKIGRMSKTNVALLEMLPELFGKEAQKYTMLVFTHGDELG